MAVMKRLIVVLVLLASPLLIGLLFTFDIINIDWISNMEIQPSFRAMEDPLPLPARSIPVQGAAYVPEVGPPDNPVEATEDSVKAGQGLYEIHCALCHGAAGEGNGPFASSLKAFPPGNLVAADSNARNLSDGALFLVISYGIEDRMPALHENMPDFEDRWHVVNYVRSLQNQANQ